jgi:hypothetical protein
MDIGNFALCAYDFLSTLQIEAVLFSARFKKGTMPLTVAAAFH